MTFTDVLRKDRIKDASRKSYQLELGFWKMAFTYEQGPLKKAVSHL